MTNPNVTVIVPVHNGTKSIATFFSCLAKPTYQEYEVIIVDDGSVDDTYEKCLSYSKEDYRIKIFKKENGGPGSARNYGIDKASGDYVAFFDIDDEFHQDVLADNYAYATKNDADIEMWNFKMILHALNGEEIEITKPVGSSFSGEAEEFFHDYLIPVLDNEMFNPPWNKLIKRSFLNENRLRFSEKYSIYEDILFSYEVLQKAQRVAINDDFYYSYIIKDSGSLLTTLHKECFDVILEIYKAALRYGDRFNQNDKQVIRFKEQFIFLVKGYIKQICINKSLSYTEKRELLSTISNNQIYRNLSKDIDKKSKSVPAKLMMAQHMYKPLIWYYHLIDYIRYGAK